MKEITSLFLLLLGYVLQLQSSDGVDDINAEDNETKRKVNIENEFKEEYCKMNATGKCSSWTWPEIKNLTSEQLENICQDVAKGEFFNEIDLMAVKAAKKVDEYQLTSSLEENGKDERNSPKLVIPVVALYCHVICEDEAHTFFLTRHGYILKPVKKDVNKENKLLFIYSWINLMKIKSETHSLLGFPNLEELMKQQKEAEKNYEVEFKQLYRESGHVDWMWPQLSQLSPQQKEKLCIAGAREYEGTEVKLTVSIAEAVEDFWLVYCFNEDGQEEWDFENVVLLEPLYCDVSRANGNNARWFVLIRGGFILQQRDERDLVNWVRIKRKISLYIDADVKKMLDMRENILVSPIDQIDRIPFRCIQ